jgi:opacity protein-like surface antigen
MKRMLVVSIFCSLFGLPGVAHAQTSSRFDLSASYSFLRADPSHNDGVCGFNLNGGDLTLGYNAKSWLTATVDVGGYAGTHPVQECLLSACPSIVSSGGTTWTYLAGPRVNFRHSGRFTPYAQVLFGIAHGSSLFVPGSQNAFAMSVGGGFDYRVTNHFSLRPIQVDYLVTCMKEFNSGNGDTQNNLRVSSGLLVHF